MTMQIPVRISERDMAELDAAVRRGRFTTRSDAVRAGIELLLREEREREIDEAYRRGYGEHPQEEWAGEAGLAAFAAFVAAGEAGKGPP